MDGHTGAGERELMIASRFRQQASLVEQLEEWRDSLVEVVSETKTSVKWSSFSLISVHTDQFGTAKSANIYSEGVTSHSPGL
jgi:hypothetical protein